MVELEAIGTGILAWELVQSGKPRDANADTPVGLSRKTSRPGGGHGVVASHRPFLRYRYLRE